MEKIPGFFQGKSYILELTLKCFPTGKRYTADGSVDDDGVFYLEI
jgi:hypothetical protein